MFRMVTGECAVNNKIAELLSEKGPGKTIRKVDGSMRDQMQSGALRDDDQEHVAALFLNMIRHHYEMHLLTSIKPALDTGAEGRHSRKMSGQFLVVYGV